MTDQSVGQKDDPVASDGSGTWSLISLFKRALSSGFGVNGVAETTVTPAAVTLVAATAKNLLAANSARIRAIIYNPLATPLYVRKATLAASAATAAAGGYDFVIGAGQQWTSDPEEWAGGFNGINATAGDVNVSESV